MCSSGLRIGMQMPSTSVVLLMVVRRKGDDLAVPTWAQSVWRLRWGGMQLPSSERRDPWKVKQALVNVNHAS
jgi:hypothetical protein